MVPVSNNIFLTILRDDNEMQDWRRECVKPMIKYRGGKSREIPWIEKYLPRFRGRYVKPFFGGGALFFYLEPRSAIINDINHRLMSFYRAVRDDYQALHGELDELERMYAANRLAFERLKEIHPNGRVKDKNEELYYHLRAQFNGTEERAYSEASLYYFINKTAYSGMIRYNAAGEFNVPFGRYSHLNTRMVTESHSRLLQRTEIFSRDYSDIFSMCTEDDFVFLDPPYDCIFSDYGNLEDQSGFNADEHERLASAFHDLPCKAMMIIGRTPLTESLYRNQIIDSYAKSYAVNIRNRFKAGATHIIVTNYSKEADFREQSTPFVHPYTIPEVAQPLLFDSQDQEADGNAFP